MWIDVVGPGKQDCDGQTQAEADHHRLEEPFRQGERVHHRFDHLEDGEGGDGVRHQRAEDPPPLEFLKPDRQLHGRSPVAAPAF